LRFNDTVEVRLLVKKLGTRSVVYDFQFRKAGELCAEGEVTAVCVTADAKGAMVSAPLPADVRAKLPVAPAAAWKG
jgi:acyl-CoA thioesterase FadM